MSEQRQLTQAFRGGWVRSGLGRPIMWAGDRHQSAKRALREADLPFGTDPRLLAVALGYRIGMMRSRVCGGEVTRNGVVLFCDTPDRRDRGLSINHGIAHQIATDEGWEHTHADVWLLTGELVAPPELIRDVGVEEVVRYAHAPEWFVREWAALAKCEVIPLHRQCGIGRRRAANDSD